MQRKKVEWNQQTYRRFVELWSAKTFFDISEQITPTLTRPTCQRVNGENDIAPTDFLAL